MSDSLRHLTIPYTETHRLQSAINKVEYELFAVLPADYKDSSASYPVIFTTDPNFILPILLGVTKSLATMIPDAIIVGVGHADLDFKELDEKTRGDKSQIYRSRDFLPWKFDKFLKHLTHNDLKLEEEIIKHSGQAEKFKDFIAAEVIPLIDKTYRTKPERTLIGHSFGGVFALWMALNHPTIFQNYLVISPILYYEDGRIFEEISNVSQTIPAKIYLCAGGCENFYPDFLENLKRFYSEISSSKNITTKLEIFEDEFHCSVVPLAISKGLRFFSSKTN